MKHILNIAVFGLSLSIQDQFKISIKSALPAGVQVYWAGLSEPNIDLFLINEAFYDSHNIQKIIEQQKPVVFKLVRSNESGGQLQGDTLFYPILQTDDLRAALQSLFFDYEPVSRQVSSLEILQGEKGIQGLENVFHEIFLPRNGYIQLFDAYGPIALVDCMTERVWPVQEHNGRSLNMTLNQSYATGQQVLDITRNQHAQDLKIWLWQMLMQSSEIRLNDIPLSESFRLEMWPQFEKGLQRRELLKIASCFSLGANLKDVHQALNLSAERVGRFVAVAQLLNMGKSIRAEDAKFRVSAEKNSAEEHHAIRSFFGKLRKKLGL